MSSELDTESRLSADDLRERIGDEVEQIESYGSLLYVLSECRQINEGKKP